MARRRLELVADLTLLEATEEARKLTRSIMDSRLRQLIGACGHAAPTICTPEELLQDAHEQDN